MQQPPQATVAASEEGLAPSETVIGQQGSTLVHHSELVDVQLINTLPLKGCVRSSADLSLTGYSHLIALERLCGFSHAES